MWKEDFATLLELETNSRDNFDPKKCEDICDTKFRTKFCYNPMYNIDKTAAMALYALVKMETKGVKTFDASPLSTQLELLHQDASRSSLAKSSNSPI